MATELVDLAANLWRPIIVAAELRGNLLRFSTGAEISLTRIGLHVNVEAYVARDVQTSRFIWRLDVHAHSVHNVAHTGGGVETLLSRHDGVTIPIMATEFYSSSEHVSSYKVYGVVVPGFSEINAPSLSLRMCDLKPGEKTWI